MADDSDPLMPDGQAASSSYGTDAATASAVAAKSDKEDSPVEHPWWRWNFIATLASEFGRGYVAIVIAVYGLAQGADAELTGFATTYLFADTLKVTPSRQNELMGLAQIPWTIKPLFGLLSDTLPIFGYHRYPYIALSALAGIGSCLGLYLQTSWGTITAMSATVFLLLGSFSTAIPDVIIDATVTERVKTHPHLAADLQALCWGSNAALSIVASAAVGPLQEHMGAPTVFLISTLVSGMVFVPSVIGWLPEQKSVDKGGIGALCKKTCCAPPVLSGDEDLVKEAKGRRAIFTLALINCVFAVGIGTLVVTVPMFVGEEEVDHVTAVVGVTAGITFGVVLWAYLREVSTVMAAFVFYTYMSGAMVPSARIMFYWYHDTPENQARGNPCLSASFLGMMGSFGQAFLLLGTVLYTKYFKHWSYQSIFFMTQCIGLVLGCTDLLWVNRLNVQAGISDQAFVFSSASVQWCQCSATARGHSQPLCAVRSVGLLRLALRPGHTESEEGCAQVE